MTIEPCHQRQPSYTLGNLAINSIDCCCRAAATMFCPIILFQKCVSSIQCARTMRENSIAPSISVRPGLPAPSIQIKIACSSLQTMRVRATSSTGNTATITTTTAKPQLLLLLLLVALILLLDFCRNQQQTSNTNMMYTGPSLCKNTYENPCEETIRVLAK